jgi:hypothetical protein
MEGDDLQLRVLGNPSIADEWPQLAPREADLLVALALSPGGRYKDWLRRNLWPSLEHDDASTVSTHVGYLKQKGVLFETTRKGGPYQLAYPPEAIDWQRFVNGARELPEEPELASIDDLLALWSGNPWERRTNVPDGLWSPVRQQLKRLLGKVAVLGERGEELQHWGTFEQMLANDPLLEAVRSPVPRPPKPRVLIVDDQIGHEIADVLGNYDTEVISSLAEWNRRKDDGRPFPHVCALVDLHLKREMTDKGGLVVVRDLKALTSMPIVLMSAELPAFQDGEELCADLGVAKVLPKHNRREGDFARVGDVIRQVVG